MTRDRDAKREVRDRMRSTGERYTQARRALFGTPDGSSAARSGPDLPRGAMVSEQLLQSLERDGYAVVSNVVSVDVIGELRRRVERLVDEELDWRMGEVRRRRDAGETDVRAFPRGSEGQLHLGLDADIVPILAGGVAEVMAAIGTPLSGRGGVGVCLPGWGGHQGLHPDLDGPAPPVGRWDAAVLTWPLSAWDGMRLVPGSHKRWPEFREAFAGAIAPHPNEIRVEAGPGDVVINSVHIWKSMTLNQSRDRRSEVWISFHRDSAVPDKIAEYWASVEMFDSDAPLDLGNYVRRGSGP